MRLRLSTFALAATGLLVLVAGCGSTGSSGGSTGAPASSARSDLTTCSPVAGDSFVALTDDKKLQNPDNVVPAVNAAAATADPEIITLLDSVSAVLDTPALIDL